MLDSSRPRTGGRRERRYGGVLIVLVLLGVVVTVYETAADEALKWRGSILFDKATGRIQDIGWFDLFSMLRPGSGFYLARLAETRNPYTAIDTPYRTKADIEAGASLFRERCASCHGDQARGGTGGPSLHDRQFRQGRSDWALYR